MAWEDDLRDAADRLCATRAELDRAVDTLIAGLDAGIDDITVTLGCVGHAARVYVEAVQHRRAVLASGRLEPVRVPR